jgi:predicted ATP-grasp superfamily ATP-dependent carboligase
MEKKIPVVIMRANDNCFLDCIRACGTAGIPVIPVIFTWEGAGEWNSESSKYFYNEVHISNPATDECKALEELLDLGEKIIKEYGEKVIIIASSDTNLLFLQNHFDQLSKYYLQMGHKDFTENCICELRKDTSADLLRRSNVDIPLTLPVIREEDILRVCKEMKFPCIYKPILKDLTSSFQNTHNKKKAIECSDSEILTKNLKSEIKNGYKLIVQEKIEFDSLEQEVSCYAYIDKEGNIRAISGQHKIIEYPHPYGTGVVSIPFYEDEFLEIVRKISSAYKWRGFLGIEFMKNKKSNKWVVIEINLRPWLSINFQAMLGFNYIELLYQDYYGFLSSFERTVVLKDFDKVRVNVTLLLKRNMHLYKDSYHAIRECIDFIKAHMGKIIFSYMIKGDERPGLGEKKSLLHHFFMHREMINELYEIIDMNNAQIEMS